MIKIKYKRILCFFAVFLILFLFLFSVTSSASSITDTDIVVYNAPTDINFHYTFYDPEATDSDLAYVYATYSYSPLLVPNYYELDDGQISYVSDQERVTNDTPIGFYSFSVPMYAPPDNYHYGRYSFSLNGPGISNDSYVERLNLQNFYLSINDFYVWDHNFDIGTITEIPEQASECSFTFFDNNDSMSIKYLSINYELAGVDSVSNVVNIMADDPVFGSDISSGIVKLTPAMFGLEGDSVIYINSLRVYFNNIPTTYRLDIGFDVDYVYNPLVNNYVSSSGGSQNPALALIPYANWIGTAVSGFMDFELFKGFTLGGIFMTLLAFSCVVWFLKLVAGG